MQVAGIDLHQPVLPEQILGALVLTGIMERIGQECLAYLELCRLDAQRLQLPTFSAYVDVVETLVNEVVALFSLKAKPDSAAKQRSAQKLSRPLFAPAEATLPKVIEMATGYLLADPTFRESWEVQRRGLFGIPEMTGRAFPAGLIVEILCQHGHNLAGSVDTIFDTLQATGFRYYDHPHLPPDSDDVGLLLRLYRYSAQPDKHRRLLQPPLRWLHMNVRQSGEIPVWLVQNEAPAETGHAFLSLWGNNCAAVEANLLLGLIDYDWPAHHSLVEKSAGNIFERLQAGGLSAAPHYVPLYTLWTIFKLVASLTAKPIPPGLRHKLAPLTQLLLDQLQVEAQRHSPGPQDAAFLTLICLSDHAPDGARLLFDPAWISLLCKRQRYDGSWPAEPLFGTPTRGELATWYASNSVTTAFCYHALKHYLKLSENNLALTKKSGA
jgi:hypothetical protein